MSISSSTLRIGGLASGMDTDTMVKQLMAAQRIPLDKLNQNKQVLEWQRDSYREVNSKLVDFRNNKLSNYRLEGSLNSYKSTVTGNTGAVSATATSSANGVSMSVVVKQLATKTGVQGDELTATNGKAVTSSTTLSQLTNGTSGSYTLSINGRDFTFSGSDTISSVVNKINSDKEAKASAIFDEVSGKVSITAKDYGGAFTLDSTTSTLSSLLNLGTVQAGKQAQIEVDGKAMGPYDSNSITINGVKLTLLEKSDSTNPSKITTQTDPDKMVSTIKEFVQSYNDLIDLMNTKVNETRYRDYAPLTDDQKKDLNEDDIKAWTEKSKSGLLKNDSNLKTALSQMRSIITDALGSSTTLGLVDVGITTGQYYERGKLYLDENKLKTAITSDPQGVKDLFQKPASETTKGGLFTRLYSSYDDVLENISKKAGTSKNSTSLTSTYNADSIMGKQLADYKTRISDMTTRLNDMENRYYKQFTAMEKSLSKLNNQSTSITNMFSS
ncbi:Flagellar hook-associated protein 2 [compost metagenome]